MNELLLLALSLLEALAPVPVLLAPLLLAAVPLAPVLGSATS